MAGALIVQGGWAGHQPDLVADIFRQMLESDGFDVKVADTLDVLVEEDLTRLALIVPVWTMGTITKEQLHAVSTAVEAGVGLAGCHGGMCDSFRSATHWQFMTGGQWVAHPGGSDVVYTVHILPGDDPLTTGIGDFSVHSEQYYLHVDPAVRVLATTRFPTADGPHAANGPVDMPVIWTKLWGRGRVYYNSLGHHADVVDAEPNRTLMRRGLLWAAGATR